MIRAIAIDDEPPALQLIGRFCAQSEKVDLERTFSDTEEALKYIHKHPVDLVFLDIQMPGIIGTEFAKKINNDIMVIFSTAHSKYAVEGFELEAIDYLLKPYDYQRFAKAVDKAETFYNHLHQRATSNNPFIFMRADYSLVKVPLNDLLYIEGLEDYTKFYFENQSPRIFRATMKSLVDKLPENQFVRIHRSYIVRMDKVQWMKGSVLQIDGKELNIGRIYKEQAFENFNKYTADENDMVL